MQNPPPMRHEAISRHTSYDAQENRTVAGGFRALIWERLDRAASDLASRRDSESVQSADVFAGLIRKLDLGHSVIGEPPWSDREWIDRMAAARRGERLFAKWPQLAPQIPKFARSVTA